MKHNAKIKKNGEATAAHYLLGKGPLVASVPRDGFSDGSGIHNLVSQSIFQVVVRSSGSKLDNSFSFCGEIHEEPGLTATPDSTN